MKRYTAFHLRTNNYSQFQGVFAMKTLITTIAVLLLCGTARAEVDLEIVWQKWTV